MKASIRIFTLLYFWRRSGRPKLRPRRRPQ